MFQLPEEDRQLLLHIAREAVEKHLSGNSFDVDIPEGAAAKLLGIFVSIHKGKSLRGCIGNIVSAEPLCRATARCAVAAAVSDPRFTPLTFSELSDVAFELSVLEQPELAGGPDDIQVGTHGVIVSKGSARGVLLPQVALEQGWDPERFLRETCRKAGLSPAAWKEQGVTIHRFTADVFGEQRIH